MSPESRDPRIQERARDKARAGREERRILISHGAAEKAVRLAGGQGRQQFSDLVNGLLVGAEARLEVTAGVRIEPEDAE